MIVNTGRTLEGGDILARPKQSGFGWHWGTALSDGSVAHTMPVIGKHVSSLAEFSTGLPITVIRPNRTLVETLQIEQRALTDLGMPYAVTANCEHDITRTHLGMANSPTLANALIGGVFGLALVVAAMASDN